MSDLFSRKSITAQEEDDEEDAFIVDTSPDAPPETLTQAEAENVPSVADLARHAFDTAIKHSVAAEETGISIASGVVGFTLGAVNASAGLVKNLVDYVGSGTTKLALTPFKEELPDLYDRAQSNFIHDVTTIPSDLMDDYNVIASAVQYEPQTEYGQRYVVNINEKLEAARRWVGDKAAGIPTVSADSKNPEVDSLAELEALLALDQSPMGTLRKLAGAAGQTSVDIALMVAGGLLTKGVGRHGKPVNETTTPKVEGFSESKLTLEALDALENSKPRFATIEEATSRITELASGKARQQITVETVSGLPVRVLGGQDAILAMKELKKRGMPIREARVNFIEKEIVTQLDKLAVASANKAFSIDADAQSKLADSIKASMKGRVVRGAVDASGNVKRELLASSGELGRKAVRDLELTAGATPRAIMVTNDAWHRVFKNLSNTEGTGAVVGGRKIGTERQLFDEFARAQRIIAIEKSKLGTGKKVKFEGGTTGHQMSNWLQALKQEIGPEKYAELSIRTNELFNTARKQLDKMLQEGLITNQEHAKMKDINYLRTEFIDKIDPLTQQKIGGKLVSVGESGIQAIEAGSTKGVVLDAEALMNEMIVRTENRIARNRASKRLYDIAKADPKNTVVQMAKRDKGGEIVDAPTGFDTIKMMVNGKQEAVYMPEWLAQEWKMSDPAISATAANIMRIVSGSAVVRPLATGYNPGFVITNMPRDIVHAWLATNSIYSSIMPKYLMQIGRDIGAVAMDSLTKTGRYEDYINEGGGLSFLTHQGRSVVAKSAGELAVAHRPGQTLVRDTLSYLNEQSEIMVRLAIRERVLRNQREAGLPPDPVEATWQARRYLDFAQGGSVVKVFDNAVPYLNATVQAYRTAARSAKENPAQFAAKSAQIAGLYAGWEAYNMLFNAEAHEQIPEKQRRSNFIIHTGNFIIDEEGNKRYEYYAVKKDQSTIAPTVWLEQLVDLYITGRPPTDNTFSYLLESLPGLSNNIPVLGAAHTYLSDYNFWYNKDIFGRDLNIENYAKFKGLPGEPTDQAFKDFGELFNLKPEALQQASRQLIPNNTYMQLAGKAYETMFADADPRELAATTEERMARMPFVNRIYKLTHPASVALDNMDRIAQPVNTEEFLRTQKLKDLLFEATRTGDYNPAREYARGFVNQDPFLYKDMMNRTIATQRLDTIFKERKQSFEDLPKSWWLGMLALSGKARAEVYFEEWTGESSERKAFMDSTAAALSGGDLNFIDIEFMYHLTKLKNGRNTKDLSD